MPGIENNLYPPIIPNSCPAFVRTATCRIYFSLSIYNNINDISSAQVIINNQSNNRTAFKNSLYATGIKACSVLVDTTRTGDDKYYINIEPSDLENGAFGINQFYKVQIRFTGNQATSITLPSGPSASWLNANQQYFSEWSSVCLVKGIDKPKLYLKNFEEDGISKDYELAFTQEVLDLVGYMYYDNNLEKETLKSYKAVLYEQQPEKIVYDSGDIYTDIYAPNEINYTLKTHLENGVKYKLIFSYETINGYTESVTYLFSILQNSLEPLAATINVAPEEENGRIKIDVKGSTSDVFIGRLIIRRTSNKTNYTIWEDVNLAIMNEGKPLNYSWYDYTVESGVWYKYGAQRKNEKGDRGILILANPVMIILDDIFLTRSKMQFKVKFDPSISSFKYNYLEAKTDTLGSKYPFFKRNGNVKYRQFSIQGLITAWCDEQGVFLNKNNIYGDFVDDYNKYNQENNITEYRDYVYEKEFRDKIIDFLYANDVKLFRSPTEGNILIRLMNISFTPNQTLGRMLYTFSAEAYEIDECNLDNFQKYGIQSLIDRNSTEEAIPPDDEKISYVYDKIGQINGEFSGTEEDLLNQLKNKYESTSKDFSTVVDKIKWLRIEFNSDPYLIEDIDGVPKKAVLTKTHSFNEDISEGYIININDQSIIISPRKYIEFADDDTEITSVYFPYPTEVTFDYTVQLEDTENSSTIYSKVYLYTKVGQLHDIYQPQDNVFKKIYGSYLADYNKTHQELISIDKLTVETEPRTVIYIKDSFDNSYFKHEIGETGVLEFYDDEAVVTGFYFSGIHLYPAENGIVVEGKYIETGVSVNSESGIKNPIENGVYTINNQRTIYYKSQFYKFNEDDEVECPIETTVDYVYELMKGSY